MVILSPQKIAEERIKDTLQKANQVRAVGGWAKTYQMDRSTFPRKIVLVVQRFFLDSRNLQHVPSGNLT